MEVRAKVWVTKDGDLAPMRYERRYQRQSVHGVERLLVSTDSRWCELMLDIVRPDSGPVICMYDQGEPGEGTRHQSEEMDFDAASRIVHAFAGLLEQSPWQNFWMFSSDPARQVVLDEHNFLYVYGELDSVVGMLSDRGYDEGTVVLPTPHMHRQYAELQDEETRLIAKLTPGP
jgi:hypothetical protein